MHGIVLEVLCFRSRQYILCIKCTRRMYIGAHWPNSQHLIVFFVTRFQNFIRMSCSPQDMFKTCVSFKSISRRSSNAVDKIRLPSLAGPCSLTDTFFTTNSSHGTEALVCQPHREARKAACLHRKAVYSRVYQGRGRCTARLLFSQ